MMLSELLSKIIDRPGIYIGHQSVPLAKSFIDGYKSAKYENGTGEDDRLYSGFNEWVANRFRITSSHDWGSIISFMGVSEKTSFELLKKLWSEYCEENATKQTEL